MRKLCLGLMLIVLINACKSMPKSLPILGNRSALVKMVDGKQVIDTVYQTIPAFKFVNQYGDTITHRSTHGKIYCPAGFFSDTVCR